MRKEFKFILLGSIVVLLNGCGSNSGKAVYSQKEFSGDGQQASTSIDSSFSAGATKQLTGLLNASTDSDALLWAMRDCVGCGPEFGEKYLYDLATQSGLLPQPLVPDVREEMIRNKQLERLNSLPDSVLGVIGVFYSYQDAINVQIKDGLVAKFGRVLTGGTRIDKIAPDFKYELFLPPKAGQTSITASQAATRWNYVLSLPNLWNGTTPASLNEHALQLIPSTVVFSEWKYMFGLNRSSDDNHVYGGITLGLVPSRSGFDVDRSLRLFDPRIDPDARRFITGKYTINYEKADAMTTAFRVVEKWSHQYDQVTLDEQAKIWRSAAVGFNRLRPGNRKFTQLLYRDDATTGAGSLIPMDAHKLPLIHLMGMQTLLQGPFIDSDAREVFSVARLDGVIDEKKATLVELTRLAETLSLYVREFKDTKDLENGLMDQAQIDQLKSAPDNLKKAVQMIMAKVMNGYGKVDSKILFKGQPAIGFSSPNGDEELNMGAIAEALYLMMQIEKYALNSTFWKERFSSMLLWWGKKFAEPLAKGQTVGVQAQDVIWSLKLVEFAKGYITSDAQHFTWLDTTKDGLQKVVDEWRTKWKVNLK